MATTISSARLQLFGGAAIESPQGAVAGRAAQRRRLGLLAILAVSGRAVSRDKLIGYLWEEADTERARKLLSESLYVIRKSLGEDSLKTPGDNVELNTAVVGSDVADFMAAIERRDDAAAVELYRGPFLDGFFIADAVEFDNWVEESRTSFARMRAEALLRLAAAAEGNRDYAAAAGHWRSLTQQDAFSATYAVGLMRALDAAGDRAGALQHARVHAALLRSEFDADPDPQVEDFAKSLQSSGPSGASVTRIPPAPHQVLETPSAPIDARPLVEPAEPERIAKRNRRGVIAAVIFGSALVIGSAILLFNRPAAQPTGGGRSELVVVMPFSVHGSAPELREGIVDLLSTDLDGAGELRAADVHAVLSYFKNEVEAPTPRRAQNIAAHFGAHYYVVGDITQVGSQVQLSATMNDAAGTNVARAATRGPADSLLVLVDQVATQLLSSRGVNSSEMSQLAVHTTRSYPALKYYLEGDAHYRAGRYRAAVSSFTRAVRSDPGFALAAYRLSAASEWNFEFIPARSAAQQANRSIERLAEHYRPLLHGWTYFLNGNAELAQREYESVLSLYPNDVEARAGLGEVLVHFNPPRGLPNTQAREAFDRVLRLAPAYGEVRYHALEFAAGDRNAKRFDELFSQLDASNPQYETWRAVRAFTFGSEAERVAAISRLQRADEMAVGLASARLAAHSHEFVGAERIARELTTASRTNQWRAGGYLLLAELAMARNNPKEMRVQLAAAAPLERDWAHELGALYALHPDAPNDAAELAAVEKDLTAWRPEGHSPSLSFFLASHATVHKHLRLYLLGMVNIRMGNVAKAEQLRRDLEQIGGDKESTDFALSLSRSLAGHIARARGDRAKAIELLETATIVAPPEFLVSPFYSRAHDRLVLGDLNRELGHVADARRWYQSLLDGYDFPYVPAATTRLKGL